jgi:hypothetical protein
MLFERRAYTLRPGTLEAFWGLQRNWNTPTSFRPLLERNIGYFSTTAGPAERIVHLYRWDSYDQAKRHLAAIVTPERMEYFLSARKLLLSQLAQRHLIGAFLVSTGPLHRVMQYRWYASRQEADAHRSALAERPAWERVRRRLSPARERESHGAAQAEPGAMDAFAVRADRLVGELGIAGAIEFLPVCHVSQRGNKGGFHG